MLCYLSRAVLNGDGNRAVGRHIHGTHDNQVQLVSLAGAQRACDTQVACLRAPHPALSTLTLNYYISGHMLFVTETTNQTGRSSQKTSAVPNRFPASKERQRPYEQGQHESPRFINTLVILIPSTLCTIARKSQAKIVPGSLVFSNCKHINH